MRKFFTLVTALLASFSLSAETVTFTLSELFDGSSTSATVTTPVKATISTNGSKANAKENKISNDGNYFQVILEDASFSAASFNGYINSNDQTKQWAFQFSTDNGANWTEEVKQNSDGIKEGHDIAVNAEIPEGANGIRIIRRSGTTALVYSISLEVGGVTPPSEDPVTKVTLDGPAEGFVGKTITITASADAKVDDWMWYVNDEVVEGAKAASLSLTPDVVGPYRVVAGARNQYNLEDGWINSAALTINIIEKPAAVPCAELYPAASGETPAEGGKVALTEASYGGKIIFAGAKEGKYESAFKYTNYGLQMCTGGADSARVELGFKLKEGSVIKLLINVRGLADTKERGFNLLAPGQKKVLGAVWKAVEQAGDTIWEKEFEYEVKAGDGLAGQNKFGLQRSNSAILQGIVVSDCGEEILPDTRPVSSVAIQGPAAGFVGQKVLLKALIEAEPDEIVWRDGYNGTMLATNVKTYELELTEAGTTKVYVEARNQYNAEGEWIESERFAINVTEQLEQLPVSGNVVWDWANAAEGEIKLTDSTTPKKNERCLLANVAGMYNDEEFNSQALLFEGEYPFRVQGDFKLCQGQLLQFNTTVPGFVSIEYSNTGNREAAEGETEGEEALRRFLTINGERVANDPGSMKSNAITTVFNIPVAAGDVAISGVMPYRTDGKPATQVEYLRIYKVQFSLDELPQAIDNTEAGVKAVKFIRNGQLFIEKNGVLFNAQGAIVQ